MVLQDQTQIATFSPDGTASTVLSIEPDPGEIYYFETLLMYTDGTGSIDRIDFQLGIWPTGKVPSLSSGNLAQGLVGTGNTVDGTTESLSQFGSGVYFTNGLTLSLQDQQGSSDASTVTAVAVIRQVV